MVSLCLIFVEVSLHRQQEEKSTFGSGSVMSELLVQYAGLDRASGGRVT